jgi:dihydrofolate reductase
VATFRIEGYVIVSAEGMLADADGVMPDSLKFDGDAKFFSAALDRVDLIVHGRNSHEGQPNSPKRRRIIVTRAVDTTAPDPADPNATLWNPAGVPFEAAGVSDGTVAIIGGPAVFDMFMDRYDTFFLSQAPHVHISGGQGCFGGVPERTPQQVLASHGLKAAEREMLEPELGVSVTAWRRLGPT